MLATAEAQELSSPSEPYCRPDQGWLLGPGEDLTLFPTEYSQISTWILVGSRMMACDWSWSRDLWEHQGACSSPGIGKQWLRWVLRYEQASAGRGTGEGKHSRQKDLEDPGPSKRTGLVCLELLAEVWGPI